MLKYIRWLRAFKAVVDRLAHKRHTGMRSCVAGTSGTNRKRGKAKCASQLSRLQRQILAWLYNHETDLDAMLWDLVDGKKGKVKELHQKGVPWSAKRFYDDAPSSSQERALSRSLSKLKARGLVICFDTAGGLGSKPRTSHVKLTNLGREAASFELEHGQTERQLRDLRRLDARRKKLWQLKEQLREAEHWRHLNELGRLDYDLVFEMPSLRAVEILINPQTNEAKEVEILKVDLAELEAEIRFLEDSIAAYPEAAWRIGGSILIDQGAELDAARAQYVVRSGRTFQDVFWDEVGEQPIPAEAALQFDTLKDEDLPF